MEEWIVLISASTISYINNIDSKRIEKNSGIQYKSSINETARKKTNTNIIMQIEQVIRNDKHK